MRHFASDPRLRGLGEGRDGYSPAQTKKAVWAQNDEQATIARRMLADAGKEVPVLPPSTWHDAEEYHQHHIAEGKSYPLVDEDDPWSALDGPGTAWGL